MKTWESIEQHFDTEISDSDLNRIFARKFWDRPIDERNNTYWHDDDSTPQNENHEWKPLPDFVNRWPSVRKILVNNGMVLPPIYGRRLSRKERTRRVMIAMLVLDKEGATHD